MSGDPLIDLVMSVLKDEPFNQPELVNKLDVLRKMHELQEEPSLEKVKRYANRRR